MCTSDFMTKEEAIYFLEDVIARLESSMQALHDEIANEAEKP